MSDNNSLNEKYQKFESEEEVKTDGIEDNKENTDVKKEKKKKNFRKYLEDILKSSYLCNRFLKRKSVSPTKRSLRNLHKQYK